MRTAPLPRSIREALPAPLGSDYAPDGLSGDLDALIDGAYSAVADVQYRPGWMNPDQVEQRRARRLAKQVVRSLPATFDQPADVLFLTDRNAVAAGVSGQGKSCGVWADLAAVDPTSGEAA